MDGIKEILYKKQGNGKDSWWVHYTDKNKLPELVFEDPSIVKLLDMSNVDINTITDKQIKILRSKLGL